MQTHGVHRFNLPHGVSYLGGDRRSARVSVSMPVDEDGYYGRACPRCREIFRVLDEDYEALPDDVRLWCVYCGHQDDHDEFITPQQEQRVRRVAQDYGRQLVGQMLDDTLGRLARRPRSHLTYRSRGGGFHPLPLPGVNEERLVRSRACSRCGLRYVVFGEHRFCPACGPLDPGEVALDALAAERRMLDVLNEIPAEDRKGLREAGVLDRAYADAIKDVVSIIETLAEATFRERVPDPETVLRGRRGKVFQRLDDVADLFAEHCSLDLRAVIGDDWRRLIETWAGRHVLVHRDGIVDEQYLRAVPRSSIKVGQRLRPTESEARDALRLGEEVWRALVGPPTAGEADPS